MDSGFDSYTGVPIQKYVSPIPNIEKGRSPFYREAELRRISAQYHIGECKNLPVPEGGEPSPAEGWYLRRDGSPANLFPVLRSSAVAQTVMDWCVRNDASVRIAIYWMVSGDLDPYFNLLDRIIEVANGAE